MVPNLPSIKIPEHVPRGATLSQKFLFPAPLGGMLSSGFLKQV